MGGNFMKNVENGLIKKSKFFNKFRNRLIGQLGNRNKGFFRRFNIFSQIGPFFLPLIPNNK